MKTFAANEKRSASAVRKARPYAHHPMGPEQQAQQFALRKLLRPDEVQAKPDSNEHDSKYEQQTDHTLTDLSSPTISGIPPGGPAAAPIQRSENAEPEEAEEEPIQAKLIQRQPDDEEEEEPVQTKLIQRQMADMSGIRPARFSYRGPEVKAERAEIRRILRSTGAQAKLTVGQPNDKYEQEADRVADQVMRMSDADVAQRQPEPEEKEDTVQTKPLADQITPLVQRQEEPPDEEEEELQAKEQPGHTPQVTPNVAADIQSLKGGGQPLADSARSFFEPRFRQDFRQVRIHTDAKAAGTAKAVNARAFTSGQDVVFGSGEYSSGSSSGRKLLSHELTHVVQQNGRHFVRPQKPHSPFPNVPLAQSRKSNEAPGIQCVHVLENDPDTAPPMSCDIATSSPTGVSLDVTFNINSGILSTTDKAAVSNFVRNWHLAAVAEPVRVDGYASIDGLPSTNWPLSCRRAVTLANELMTPSDGSPGIPSSSVELFAQGETDQFSSALEPNRRAQAHISNAPNPAPQLRIVPCRSLPRQVFNRGACGTGSDFTHHDFPSLAGVSRTGRALVWQADNLSIDFRLRNDMRVELGLLGGSEGLRMVSHFTGGSGRTLTHNRASSLGSDALGSNTFSRLNTAVATVIDAELTRMAGSGRIDCSTLSIAGASIPAVSFSFSDGYALKAIIGGTQGLRIRLRRFSVNSATRSYTIGLQYLICDDFGVDTSDLYSPGLAAFWVLQHRRSGNVPFINELNLPTIISGTF